MAEERMIELGIISASNLKDVNYLSKMETYAVLTFAPYVEYTTQVDSKGGLNPRWGEKIGFMVPESIIRRGDAHLKVEIFTLSTLGPKFVSEASIPLSDLSVLSKLNVDPIYKRYPLKTSTGDYHGDLHVSFALGDKVVLQQKGEHPHYPIVTQLGTHASGAPTYDSQQSSYPTPPTSKPSHVTFNLSPSTPTKHPKSQYESDDTQFSRPQFQPTTYYTDPHSSKTPSGFDTPPPSTFSPFPSRPAKPTTPPNYADPSFSSKPHTLSENYETFPPSYANPLSSKPPPKASGTFTQPPPYGLPYEGGDSVSYSPIKSPRASPKFGTHNVPISRVDEPTSLDQSGYGRGDGYPVKTSHAPPKYGMPRVNEFGAIEQSGYGHGADYPTKSSKFGTSKVNVPISKVEDDSTRFQSGDDRSGYGRATQYGSQVPTTSINHLFGSPLGKVLLTELGKSNMAFDRRY